MTAARRRWSGGLVQVHDADGHLEIGRPKGVERVRAWLVAPERRVLDDLDGRHRHGDLRVTPSRTLGSRGNLVWSDLIRHGHMEAVARRARKTLLLGVPAVPPRRLESGVRLRVIWTPRPRSASSSRPVARSSNRARR